MIIKIDLDKINKEVDLWKKSVNNLDSEHNKRIIKNVISGMMDIIDECTVEEE